MTKTAVVVRAERAGDETAVYRVNELAFKRPDEANLVDKLRAANLPLISLVAEVDSHIVGHILFSPVTIEDETTSHDAIALGPMAVLPDYQGQGVGSALVRAGLAACKEAGHPLAIVLGHADFYPRFGFVPSRPFGIRWEHDVPAEVFMVAELEPGAAAGVRGVVHYHPAFDGV